METKNDTKTISDREFLALLHAAKENDKASMLQLIELFKVDIHRISHSIHMPKEDAVSQIVLEFLEYIKSSED